LQNSFLYRCKDKSDIGGVGCLGEATERKTDQKARRRGGVQIGFVKLTGDIDSGEPYSPG
jgi:hypothetical protein